MVVGADGNRSPPIAHGNWSAVSGNVDIARRAGPWRDRRWPLHGDDRVRCAAPDLPSFFHHDPSAQHHDHRVACQPAAARWTRGRATGHDRRVVDRRGTARPNAPRGLACGPRVACAAASHFDARARRRVADARGTSGPRRASGRGHAPSAGCRLCGCGRGTPSGASWSRLQYSRDELRRPQRDPRVRISCRPPTGISKRLARA